MLILQVVGYSEWTVTGPVLAGLLALSFSLNFVLVAAYIGSKRRLSEALVQLDRNSYDRPIPMTPINAARALAGNTEDEELDLSNLESRTPGIFASREAQC